MATRRTKGEISAAFDQLRGMKEMFDEIRQHEGHHEAGASIAYAARSGSNYLKVLKDAKSPYPEWVIAHDKSLKAYGWML